MLRAFQVLLDSLVAWNREFAVPSKKQVSVDASETPSGSSEQCVIDSSIAAIHSGESLTRVQIAALEETIKRAIPSGDVWNSSWPGFRETCQIGMAVELDEVIREVREDWGETGDDESTSEAAVQTFRSVIEQSFERGPGFYCKKICATDGREAWICFCHNDAAETTMEGLFLTPLAAEENLRAQGWVFPSEHEVPPSGVQDNWSDEHVLHMLRQPVRKAE
jgi:hypothetical protein